LELLQRQKEVRHEMEFKQPKKETLKVIVDSNALFIPLQFKVDIFAELKTLLNRNFELILLSAVKHELETLAEKGGPKIQKNAIYALELGNKCKYYETKGMGNTLVDDVIVKMAIRWSAPVFTNDKQLRKRLRDISIPVIYLRQKSRLGTDGMI